MQSVKIVIWDLDDTIWKGTISEGQVFPDHNIISIIRKLTDCGIINSVVSKNDYLVAKKKLEEINIFDYFIYPSINWDPKGQRVHHLLKTLKLRPTNALFVDDNHSNLKEVEFYNPGIMVMPPWKIKENDIIHHIYESGKVDIDHTRLKQYKQIVNRAIDEDSFSNNIDFLSQSNIQIQFEHDCINVIDRIHELIQRTNQLNFTKKRISKVELYKTLNDPHNKSVYIKVRDKYGDYGIVGFYVLFENKLIHFLFSCRILGLGIENYVWKKLNYPSIEYDDIAKRLSDSDTKLSFDWIQEITSCNDIVSKNYEKSKRILMIGTCNLRGISFYLDYYYCIDEEFRVFKNNRDIFTSFLTNILGSLLYDKKTQSKICEIHPYLDKDISYHSRIFDNNYDYIILSLVDENQCIMTRWKQNPEILVPMYVKYIGYLNSIFSDSELNKFYSSFDIIGLKSINMIKNDLNKLIELLRPEQRLIIVNGCEIDVSNYIGNEMVERNIQINFAIDDVIKKYDNVQLLDVRNIITDINDLDISQMDARHFNRNVYFRLSQELVNLIENNDLTNDQFMFDDILYIKSTEDLVKYIQSYKRFYLYGAGKVGHAIKAELHFFGLQEIIFVVSKIDSFIKNDDTILELQDISYDENCLIIITVGILMERQIISNLRKAGIKRYALLERSYYNRLT